MEKEFIPYEQALTLKELGFDEPCFGYRDGGGYLIIKQMPHCVISTPTFSQAFRWFREKYGLHPHIFSREGGAFIWCVRWYVDGLQKDIPYDSSNTYEEAELKCLKKLIEIVKNK